jgi:hypothetical protein
LNSLWLTFFIFDPIISNAGICFSHSIVLA